ncbi:MAG: hypothetical protein JNK25_03820 [Phycisphaerae bacterium]|nr:hypothetical protein [Phycisphaerae bacterium]
MTRRSHPCWTICCCTMRSPAGTNSEARHVPYSMWFKTASARRYPSSDPSMGEPSARRKRFSASSQNAAAISATLTVC